MADYSPRKLTVTDKNLSDDRIPRGLILMYGDTPYITKAGLEWKANHLFGGAGYSLTVQCVEYDREKQYALIKSTLTVLANGATFTNFGEASVANTASGMHRNVLHLAVTRAECRVLRMATACGYAAYDEVATLPKNGGSEFAEPDAPATEAQKKTLASLKVTHDETLTKAGAAELIRSATEKGRKV